MKFDLNSKKIDIPTLQKALKRKRRSKLNALDRFHHEVLLSYLLYHLLKKRVKGVEISNEVRTAAKKNFIVNCITCLEVFCKDLIMEFEEKWNSDGISDLLKDKISLGRAFYLIRDAKLNRLELISYYNSFSNIESIDHVFSTLTHREFLKELSKFDTEHLLPSRWQMQIINVFEIRNKIVHEGHIGVIKDSSMPEILGVFAAYARICYDYFRVTEFK